MRIKVGILGATGMVGQQYVQLLENHPYFEIGFLAASNESAGKTYEDALADKGKAFNSFSSSVSSLKVHRIDEIPKDIPLIFSALATDVAKIYEGQYAKEGIAVMSNASAHRLDPDVPVLIPELNAHHLRIIPEQQKRRGWKKGFIIAKPNCSLQSYLIPLYPLHQAFQMESVVVTTMQAVSGAGYPGVSSLDMIDNIIPYIHGEEEKSENEPLKILGNIQKDQILPLKGLSLSVHCNRVPVLDGHMACVTVKFAKKPKKEEILTLWKEFKGVPQELKLPSAPAYPLIYKTEKDRPQPRLDRETDKGMAVTIGRLRDCSVFDVRFVALSHNTLRGAASGGVLNAELIYKLGYL